MKATRRKVTVGKDSTYALEDAREKIANIVDDILEIGEEEHTKVYASDPHSETSFSVTGVGPVPPVTTDEVATVLQAMNKGKVAGDDAITSDILCLRGHLVLRNLAALLSRCVSSLMWPKAWKNADLVLPHIKGDAKELKKCGPISRLSVTYRLFTKVVLSRISATLDSQQS